MCERVSARECVSARVCERQRARVRERECVSASARALGEFPARARARARCALTPRAPPLRDTDLRAPCSVGDGAPKDATACRPMAWLGTLGTRPYAKPCHGANHGMAWHRSTGFYSVSGPVSFVTHTPWRRRASKGRCKPHRAARHNPAMRRVESAMRLVVPSAGNRSCACVRACQLASCVFSVVF